MVAVDICNLALSYLGDTATVASIDPPDGSVQAEHCARFYPMALTLMLESHEWSFATKRVALALLTTPYDDRWQFAYARPADGVKLLTLIPASRYNELMSSGQYFTPNWRTWRGRFDFEDGNNYGRDFETEIDASGRAVILSGMCDAVVRYVSSQTQTSNFPALFTDALAWKLGSMLAGPLLKGDVGAAESKRCLQMAMGIGAQAMVQDANQQKRAPRPEPVWMRDR